MAQKNGEGQIRAGIGGWTYEPWRETFYPKGLTQARELEYASRQVTAIEINGTFYRAQKPESFAKWRDATPDDFVFAVKAVRYATNRKVLADAGESIERFVGSGLVELGTKLGPILWQFAPTKRFDAEDFEAFLKLLPREIGGRPARHVLEPRHESFVTPEFVTLVRRYGAAIVYTDSDEYPSIGDITADFVYARLVRTQSSIKTGYNTVALDAWAKIAHTLARGSEPKEFPRVDKPVTKGSPRDVFMFFISGAKERAPAAAQELLKRL
ncbi:MAG TPA: DUF72 domain-containing protein [Burkholderiales bacterium]|nr:DUF72 domain-containing protein [Burkholderiales bacterium]